MSLMFSNRRKSDQNDNPYVYSACMHTIISFHTLARKHNMESVWKNTATILSDFKEFNVNESTRLHNHL